MSLKKSSFAPDIFPNLPMIQGLKLSVMATNIRYKNRVDLLCVRFDKPANTAGVFTLSSMPSAPVDYCRNALKNGAKTSIVVVNAGNSNAFTGRAGFECCETVARILAENEGHQKNHIFQASTGVIGQKLDGKKLGQFAVDNQSQANFEQAASAIMTTDTFPKGAGCSIQINGKTINIAGIAKGSGMIAPNMGTMLAFIFTDADIDSKILQDMTERVTQNSFNAITVDGDTSTSDSFGVFATGASAVSVISEQDQEIFYKALLDVTTDLALQIVKDGEGISKFVTITVNGASDNEAARKIGLSIANSPLVKTAIAGEDANWGRIIMGIGKSGEKADRDKTSVSIGGVTIAKEGEAVDNYDETPVVAHMKGSHIDIIVDVGIASGTATVYTTDLTHGYIDINGSYRS